MYNFISPPAGTESRQKWLHSEFDSLRQDGNFEARLDRIDKTVNFGRAYVMGNGRSGTWLLTALISTLKGVDIHPHEVPVELFGVLATASPLLVLKRNVSAYERIERIPHRIHIAYIVRHPFDVLTSHNSTTGRKYHVRPHVYLGNMLALQYLIDTKRPNTSIFRYEDLVRDPDAAQARLAAVLGRPAACSASLIEHSFRAAPEAAAAMHGVRLIDTHSIGKHRNDPGKIAYLAALRPRLGRTLDWVAETFDYDVSLPQV